MTQGKTSTIFADEINEAKCTGPNCGARVKWVRFVKSGRRCPFNEIVILHSGEDQASRRPTHVIDLERSHYATCPDAETFRAKKGTTPATRQAAVARLNIDRAIAEINHAIDAMGGLFSHPPTDLDTALRQAGLSCNKALQALGAPIRLSPERAAASRRRAS